MQVIADPQPTTPFQVGCEAVSELPLPARAHDSVPIARLAEFKLNEAIQHLLAVRLTRRMPMAARAGNERDDQSEAKDQTHGSLHLKKWTRIGGDCAAIGNPAVSCAGSNRVLSAQRRAAAPNPNPGSASTETLSALPSARTIARNTTVCSFTCWASASAGQEQFQAAWSSETGRARLRMAGETLRVVPGITPPSAGLRLVPELVVAPPA